MNRMSIPVQKKRKISVLCQTNAQISMENSAIKLSGDVKLILGCKT